MGGRFDYQVSFRVTHPTLDAATIAAQLRMTPKVSWTAGEPRKTRQGAPLEGIRKESYCTIDIGSGDDGELTQCLTAALSKLTAAADFLRHMRESGGSLMFYVFWYPNGDTGHVFGADLLRNMAEMGISLGINVYDDRPEG